MNKFFWDEGDKREGVSQLRKRACVEVKRVHSIFTLQKFLRVEGLVRMSAGELLNVNDGARHLKESCFSEDRGSAHSQVGYVGRQSLRVGAAAGLEVLCHGRDPYEGSRQDLQIMVSPMTLHPCSRQPLRSFSIRFP